ncbi:unnamed protein product [Cuscuta campestris]|uniref:Uncharacterized protein n=1 Tax=Cuscuta campestris TaxID=132261 RepID=A0A484L5G0_9ASTE|nr:unnamed protein product [Cuscuta campestris]
MTQETMHVVEADLGTLHKISDQKGIDNKVIDQQVMEDGLEEGQKMESVIDSVETTSQAARAVEDLDPTIWDISPYSEQPKVAEGILNYLFPTEQPHLLNDVPTEQPQVLTDIPTEPSQIVNDIPNEPPQMPNVVPIEPRQVLTDIPTKQPQILNDIPTEPQQVLNDDPSDDAEEQHTKDIAIDQPKDTARQKRVVKCPDKFTHSNKKLKTRKAKSRQGPQTSKQKTTDGGDDSSQPNNVEDEAGMAESYPKGPKLALTAENVLFLAQGLLSKKKKANDTKYTSQENTLNPKEFWSLWGHDETMTKTWYHGFFYPHEWMDDVHVTVALKYLVMKAQEYGLTQPFAVTDSLFVSLLKKEYDNYLGKRKTIAEAALNTSILKPILGAVPELGGR